MAISKKDGKWIANCRINGKQYIRRFKTKYEAERFIHWAKTESDKSKEWLPKKQKPERHLSKFIQIYYTQHVIHLTDKIKLMGKLKLICELLGDPLESELTTKLFNDYKAMRIESGISPVTVNKEHAYLRACINKLIKCEEWTRPNPLKNVDTIKTEKREMGYLEKWQITELFDKLKTKKRSDAYLVALVCISTGARWGEAEKLEAEDVKNNIIRFKKTKGKKVRHVPISSKLAKMIKTHKKGRLFTGCMKGFRTAVHECSFTLEKGQMTHVLRHTFASHYMMNGGRIEVLQKILGHSSIKQTEQYAHLAPDFLNSVIELNPANDLVKNW